MKDELATKEGEFEKILSLAEELQENCDRYSSRISINRMIELIIIVFSITMILIFSFRYKELGITLSDLLFVDPFALILCVLFLYTNEYIIVRNYIKKRRRDSRALYEIVEMLRELGEFQGVKEGWSELDRAQYRIRLSRFGIGDSDFDFLNRDFVREGKDRNFIREGKVMK